MPLKRWLCGVPAVLVALAIGAATPAHALRIATWNVAKYSGSATPQPNMRTVVAGLNPDVIVLQELNSDTGRQQFLDNVLNNIQPGEWASSAWFELDQVPSEGGAIFYKPAKAMLAGVAARSINGPRKVLAANIWPVG